jgi:glycerol uptake facilitator-like aquaporin
MSSALARRLVAEAVGTGFLVAAVVGSGIAAQRLSPTDAGLQLLENALVTGAVLTALILALGSVSAAFNPVVTLVLRGRGEPMAALLAVIAAQVAGGAVGAVTANLMFDQPAVTVATTVRSGSGVWLAEVVATVGLVLVIAGAARAGGPGWVAVAVGGYLAGAYWFTSSTSFANPAVTLARTLSDTFAGISPGSAPGFLVAQGIGGLLGYLLCRTMFPVAGRSAPDVATAPQGVT